MKSNCNRNRSNLSSYLLSDSFHRIFRNFENKDPYQFSLLRKLRPPTKPIRKIYTKSNNDRSKIPKFIITVKFDQKLGGKNRTEDNLTDQNLFRLQFDFIFQQIRFQGLLVFVISKTKTGLRSQVLVFVTPAAVDLVLHTRKNSSDLIRTPLKLFFFFFFCSQELMNIALLLQGFRLSFCLGATSNANINFDFLC